jgi:hypothetical protein
MHNHVLFQRTDNFFEGGLVNRWQFWPIPYAVSESRFPRFDGLCRVYPPMRGLLDDKRVGPRQSPSTVFLGSASGYPSCLHGQRRSDGEL